MDELNQIRNRKIREILNMLSDSFSLSIQGSIKSIKNHKKEIINILERLKIEYKEEEQNSPWGYGVDAINIKKIDKGQFLEVKLPTPRGLPAGKSAAAEWGILRGYKIEQLKLFSLSPLLLNIISNYIGINSFPDSSCISSVTPEFSTP